MFSKHALFFRLLTDVDLILGKSLVGLIFVLKGFSNNQYAFFVGP